MRNALAEHPHVGEVRVEGMLCAVELVEARQGRTFFEPAGQQGPKVAAALLKRGVSARAMPQGDIVGFAPPLCLTEAETDLVVAATRAAVAEVLPGASRPPVLASPGSAPKERARNKFQQEETRCVNKR